MSEINPDNSNNMRNKQGDTKKGNNRQGQKLNSQGQTVLVNGGQQETDSVNSLCKMRCALLFFLDFAVS